MRNGTISGTLLRLKKIITAKTNPRFGLCYTVKPGYNALEGTGPREPYRRQSVIRGK